MKNNSQRKALKKRHAAASLKKIAKQAIAEACRQNE
jgi:hypothetical protein